jgi:pyridoxine 5'-phosphate synthase PdxJ
MIFIVRTTDGQLPGRADAAQLRVVRSRATPAYAGGLQGGVDLFCAGDDDAPARCRAYGWDVVELHDGWYADDTGGGLAVWGNGRYWEVRATPFEIIAHD